MARIRTIKPEFFTSLTVAGLPYEARLTFIGLWTHVDDEGRCVDDARLVKAAIWPLDDRTASDVESDLAALSESSLITRYIVGERSYLAVTGWDEHQKINRPTKSRIPGPSRREAAAIGDKSIDVCEAFPQAEGHRDAKESPLTEHSVSRHGFPSEDSLAERNREQGKEHGTGKGTTAARLRQPADDKPSTKKPPKLDHNTDPAFAEFWSAVPEKSGKPSAYGAWLNALKKPGVTPQLLTERMTNYATWIKRTGATRVKYPQGWLNDERWNDASATGQSVQRPDSDVYHNPASQDDYDAWHRSRR